MASRRIRLTRRQLIQELVALPFGDLDTEVMISTDNYVLEIERLTYKPIEIAIVIEAKY